MVEHLRSLAADPARELDVLRHDGDTLGMDGAKIGVLEEADEVRFGCLLKSHDGRRLEAEIGLEVLRDLTNEALERKLADQQLSGLLVFADFTQGDGSWAVTMGLLDTARSWR